MTTFITALAILIGLLIGGAIALRAWMSAGDKARAEIDAGGSARGAGRPHREAARHRGSWPGCGVGAPD